MRASSGLISAITAIVLGSCVGVAHASPSQKEASATWYNGRKSVCIVGDLKIPKTEYGIAHKTIPKGTVLELEYKGRKVNVVVNDRGTLPNVDFDVTRVTASKLDFLKTGRVKLKYRILGKYKKDRTKLGLLK